MNETCPTCGEDWSPDAIHQCFGRRYTISDLEQVKPCPFCGGTNIDSTMVKGINSIAAGCFDCGGCGPHVEWIEGESVKCEMDSLAAWNRRILVHKNELTKEGE